jgi:hypothetical protein
MPLYGRRRKTARFGQCEKGAQLGHGHQPLGILKDRRKALGGLDRWSSAARVRSMTMAPMGVGTMPPGSPLEHCIAELAFQLGEALRQGGLGEADAFGGRSDLPFQQWRATLADDAN